MNGSTEATKSGEMSFARTVAGLARHYLGGRCGLIVLGVIVVTAGLALSWSWLAAVGIAPLLLALAPCAAMCALGLCMSRMGGKSCSSDSESGDAGTKAKSSSAPGVTRGGDQP